jgi:hypothetical protein
MTQEFKFFPITMNSISCCQNAGSNVIPPNLTDSESNKQCASECASLFSPVIFVVELTFLPLRGIWYGIKKCNS